MWPFRKPEIRQSQPFTDLLQNAIVSAATGEFVSATGTAALEAAAGLVSRSFASAEVKDAPANIAAAITPSILACIGRELIRRGESMHLIEVNQDTMQLHVVGSWDIRGEDNPASWFVRADLFGPSGNRTIFRSHASFLHCRYASDPARPWLGLGPLQWASSTSRLHGDVSNALLADMRAAAGHVVPMPANRGASADDSSDPLNPLRTAIKNAGGKSLFVASTRGAFGGDPRDAPSRDWKQERLGPNPPEVLAGMLDSTSAQVLAACGVDPILVGLSSGDGTLARESYRRFERTTLRPLARIVETELRAKMDAPELQLDFNNLRASDFAGVARSFKGLVEAGVAPAAAAAALDLEI